MKKRIDQLQAENQTYKSDLDRQRATVFKSPFFLFKFNQLLLFRMIQIEHFLLRQQNQRKKLNIWV